MLTLILISVWNSHQSTNHILLYKRTLCTDEASGMEILADLVQSSFIETSPHILPLIITVSIATLLILLHMSYEHVALLTISCTFPSPCHWLRTANCDNASATGCWFGGTLLSPCIPTPFHAATMVRVGDTLPSSA